MKKIQVYYITTIGLFLLLLTACFPTGKPVQKGEENSISEGISSEDNIEVHLAENLDVKAKVYGNDKTSFQSADISHWQFDEDKVAKVFSKGKKIKEISESDSNVLLDFKSKLHYFDDDSWLHVDIGNIMYHDKVYSDKDYEEVIYYLSSSVRPDIKDIYTKDELDNFDKGDAIDTVSKTIKDIGLSVGEPYLVAALDYDTLVEGWEEWELPNGKKSLPWEKEDEAYVVMYKLYYNGTDIWDEDYMDIGHVSNVFGSHIVGVVTRKGLIYLKCSGIYEVNGVKKEDIVPIPLGVALEQVKNKYKDTLLTDPILISKITMRYVAVITDSKSMEMELVPAWICDAKQTFTITDGEEVSNSVNTFPIVLLAEDGRDLTQ